MAITVKDAFGANQVVETPAAVGQQVMAASKPVAIASNQSAVPVTVPADPFGVNADVASATGSLSAKLRAIATVLGTTAWDLSPGTGGTRTQRVALDTGQVAPLGQAASAASMPVVVASDQSPVPVVGKTITQAASSTITRPANATPYASGQLVANSVTAGSVAALQFLTLARVSGGSGLIVGAAIQKSSNVITNAAFRIHFFNAIPTFVTAGDGSAISTVVVASAKGYLGYVDIPAMVGFSDVAWGSGAPDNARGSIPYVATAQIIYAIVEARGAYTPASAEVLTIYTMALQD